MSLITAGLGSGAELAWLKNETNFSGSFLLKPAVCVSHIISVTHYLKQRPRLCCSCSWCPAVSQVGKANSFNSCHKPLVTESLMSSLTAASPKCLGCFHAAHWPLSPTWLWGVWQTFQIRCNLQEDPMWKGCSSCRVALLLIDLFIPVVVWVEMVPLRQSPFPNTSRLWFLVGEGPFLCAVPLEMHIDWGGLLWLQLKALCW